MAGKKARHSGVDVDVGNGEMSLAFGSGDAAGAVFHADAHARDAGQIGKREGTGVFGLSFGLFFVEKLLNEIAGDVERGTLQRKRADDGLHAKEGKVAYLNAGLPHMKFQVVHAAAQQGEVRGVDGGHGQEGKRHFADAALHVEF